MKAVEIITGGIFTDHRGKLTSLNDFRFDEVKRVYFLTHPDTSVVRGWNGHKREKKFFCCVKGAFALAVTEIADWEKPDAAAPAQIINLNENTSQIVCVSPGCANAMKALEPDSVMMVFSSNTLEDAAGDNYKFAADLWVDWEKLEALDI
ncbi:MAG: dTDP-6-deoxy-3,4-keto-hexulose isomerase [Lentisphaerae bacterium]|nr:dTDP-6-deoxy-3,4-keto-hexulose isomerase [Lentisphaerota bacterium]